MGGTPIGLSARVLETRGPFLSLYLDTRAATEEGPKKIELRWHALRHQAAEQGAPDAWLELLDDLVDGSHLDGDGLAAVVADDEVVLRRHLSAAIDDGVAFGGAPRLLPLFAWIQENPLYAVVLVDRIGAEIHLIHPFRPDEEIDVEGWEWPVSRVGPGGWSQRRFQQRAENLWEENAEHVAQRVADVATGRPVELVVVSGDVRAVEFLKDNLPQEVLPRLFEIQGTQAHELEVIEEDMHKAVAAHAGQALEAILEVFQEERGQQDRGVEGWEATCDALRKAQVHTLLVADAPVDRTAYLVVDQPAQVAVERGLLEGLGVGEVVEANAQDALVWAAVATGAEVRAIPQLSERHAPAEGIGAILRYA